MGKDAKTANCQKSGYVISVCRLSDNMVAVSDWILYANVYAGCAGRCLKNG